ncbi:hypothetical protein EDEG_00136 [Edhazardia aedis USNM 41457]|uniref:B box-type domain-containing protein n=1 Tax=Edhazardia aedis (strain USNM 41457) TaxID=1003232 RepID=J9D994_EDHAE|nr:hypothetical protein EDEG_00136 [Edhazardia aedis USNM 41457]|eukprot:EJW04351.1 hypothetical protein EDEG_00136 [Edhazardia aedis USNM 41457]
MSTIECQLRLMLRSSTLRVTNIRQVGDEQKSEVFKKKYDQMRVINCFLRYQDINTFLTKNIIEVPAFSVPIDLNELRHKVYYAEVAVGTSLFVTRDIGMSGNLPDGSDSFLVFRSHNNDDEMRSQSKVEFQNNHFDESDTDFRAKSGTEKRTQGRSFDRNTRSNNDMRSTYDRNSRTNNDMRSTYDHNRTNNDMRSTYDHNRTNNDVRPTLDRNTMTKNELKSSYERMNRTNADRQSLHEKSAKNRSYENGTGVTGVTADRKTNSRTRNSLSNHRIRDIEEDEDSYTANTNKNQLTHKSIDSFYTNRYKTDQRRSGTLNDEINSMSVDTRAGNNRHQQIFYMGSVAGKGIKEQKTSEAIYRPIVDRENEMFGKSAAKAVYFPISESETASLCESGDFYTASNGELRRRTGSPIFDRSKLIPEDCIEFDSLFYLVKDPARINVLYEVHFDYDLALERGKGLCEKCQQYPASMYCLAERASFCKYCDEGIHDNEFTKRHQMYYYESETKKKFTGMSVSSRQPQRFFLRRVYGDFVQLVQSQRFTFERAFFKTQAYQIFRSLRYYQRQDERRGARHRADIRKDKKRDQRVYIQSRQKLQSNGRSD